MQHCPLHWSEHSIMLAPNGRVLMTRDMELIRKIFIEIQRRKDAQLHSMEIQGVDEAILGRHLEMLLDAGLIDGMAASETYNAPFPKILVKDLSWEGHDVAGALLDDGVWKKIKETYTPLELSKLTLKALGEVAKGLITKWALSKAGL